jgi:hypothetical protein
MRQLETHEFKVDGTLFELSSLKLKQSLKVEALLVEVFLPALAALEGAKFGAVDPAALAGLERVGELVDAFAGVCKFDRTNSGKATVALAPMLDEVFARRNAALLAWLAACVEWQYSDFFDGTGRLLLEETASRYASLLESIGGSGDSSPTNESPTD